MEREERQEGETRKEEREDDEKFMLRICCRGVTFQH